MEKKRVYVRLVGSTKERLAYMKKFIEEFKAFALKGNMVDLAVGMIIGSAFTSIVNSLVNDIFMPVLSILRENRFFQYVYCSGWE